MFFVCKSNLLITYDDDDDDETEKPITNAENLRKGTVLNSAKI